MKAIAKIRSAPGADLIETTPGKLLHGHVRVKVLRTSVCGTDFHIYNWDHWSQSRVKLPCILGHEMCGVIEELGEGVRDRSVGEFVASESHIVCGKCVQCLASQANVCANTRILGVDVDGVFAPSIIIPEANARPTHNSISPEVATIQDPLGNAVHTALDGPVKDRTILITGCGPIGLFSIAVCKAAGARQVWVTEVSPYRLELAEKMGADLLLNPKYDDIVKIVNEKTNSLGVDVTLEMSGYPDSLHQAIRLTRPGGRISMLGIFPDDNILIDVNAIVMKGLQISGIAGRKLYETWDQMHDLLSNKNLDITPAITHTLHYTEFVKAMELIKLGKCGKVVFHVND